MRVSGVSAIVALTLVIFTHPAWAAEAARTDQSGTLVLIFLGFCALIVVAQMVPALIMMMGTISGFARKIAARKQVAVVKVNKDKP